MNDTEIGRKLVKEFVNDIAKQLKTDLIYTLFGSLVRGNYIHGKSDIDIMILPKHYPKHGELSPSKFVWMNEHSKKYGIVFKKGRDIGVFDVMIFVNAHQQKVIRQELLNNKDIKVYETNLFENKEVEKSEKN